MVKINPLIIAGAVGAVVVVIILVVVFSSSSGKKYLCSQDSTGAPACNEDPNGFYDDINVCKQNCKIGGGGTKYTCNAGTKKCVEDPNGTYPDQTLCNIRCANPPI